MFVLFVILIPATILMIVWLLLLSRVEEEDWIAAAFCKVLDNRAEMERLQQKAMQNQAALEQYSGFSRKIMGLFLSGSEDKAIAKLEEQSEALQKGDLSGVNLLAMPGYVLQRRFDTIGRGSFHKNILEKCIELYGRKYAYPIIGLALTMAAGALLLGVGNTTGGLGVLTVGLMLVIVLVYALYDELGDQINKRRAAISRQFPNVVSKLALLVTSGMIMDRAWRETAQSQSGELYMEMRKTSEELANLVEPAAAYAGFIDRCNTKETTKLASAIIQNQTKGNAEVGVLLKAMAHEAWQERRHTAKRDSEAANSKLMIPTMLLFIAILVMIMVPVATSFSGI